MSEAKQAALRAREASRMLSQKTEEERNKALFAMAEGLREKSAHICEQNALDMSTAREKGTDEPLLDRLFLDESIINAMADALEDLASLQDPIGRVQEERELYNGLFLKRVSVPLGVVAMVYEARPNVTADAAGICIKSGNACILRGGSLAVHSNIAIAQTLRGALESVGFPADGIVAIESTDRVVTDELLKLHGLIDVLIPRGGAGLIQHCVEEATVPVIETGVGNCHVYVHESADFPMALSIIVNAKTQRPGVCNACESVLVDRSIAPSFVAPLVSALRSRGVTFHIDGELVDILREEEVWGDDCVVATENDWGKEYLDLEISIKVVEGAEEAIAHINHYGTSHSEAIVACDEEVINAFYQGVDAAAVYANASTRFTDGGEFGLGAEIGISTQKLHVRGPFALEALTTYKYLIKGSGQVRG